jgi:hypothetical protein
VNLNGEPVLSRYNEISNSFEYDSNTTVTPNGQLDAGGSIIQYPEFTLILLDSNDVFWFFANKDAIYSYQPDTQRIIKHVSLADYGEILHATISSDGSIYFRNRTFQEGLELEDGQIYQYFPAIEAIEPVHLPGGKWPKARNILADSQGRLWLGVYGWKEPDGTWITFHPKMKAFLFLNRNLPLWRYYTPPSVLTQSSDGRLWFLIPRSSQWKTLRSGLAWYDPLTNQGCWFTSEGYNVAEDTHKTMWLVAEDKLYQYKLLE